MNQRLSILHKMFVRPSQQVLFFTYTEIGRISGGIQLERILIGIMVDGKNSKSTTLKLYEKHNQLPIRLIAFSADDIMLNKMAVRGLYRKGKLLKEKVFPFPRVVYNRSFHKHA
jgi:hypothetical protein